jgi:hypothetical protein
LIVTAVSAVKVAMFVKPPAIAVGPPVKLIVSELSPPARPLANVPALPVSVVSPVSVTWRET